MKRYGRFQPAKEVSSLLKGTFRRFGISKEMERYSCFTHWHEVVGEEIARIAIPERIVRNRIIIVRVLDPNWAQELTLRKTEIIKKLEAYPDAPTIEDIRFVVGGPRDQAEVQALKKANE